MHTIQSISFILLLFFSHSSCLTNKSVQLTQALDNSHNYILNGDFKILEVDKLANIYIVDSNNEIKQYNKNMTMLFRFSLNSLGDIQHLDVSNPLKILVYYPDFQHVIFLDNTLSEQKRLNLNVLGYWNTTGMALSRENNIWTYNTIDNNLIKISDQGKMLLSSNELYFEDPLSLDNIRIFELEEKLYLYDNSVIHVFGNFGEFLSTHLIPNQACQFNKTGIFYLNDNKIYHRPVHIRFDQADTVIFEGQNIRDFYVSEKGMYILDDKGFYFNKY